MAPHRPLPRKTFIPLTLSAMLSAFPLATQVQADSPPPSFESTGSRLYVPPVPQSGEAQIYLKLMRGEKLCAASLSLQVKNATIEDIVAQVQKSMASYMAATKSAPAYDIEVRNVRQVRLSFTSKNSTVGAIFNASAMLAGAKVWIFTDHLLIAPEEALSPQELAEKQKRFAGALSLQNPTGRFSDWARKQSAFTYAIADNLKELGLPGSASLPPAPATKAKGLSIADILNSWARIPATESGTQATFAQLSPDAQVMVRELVDKLKQWQIEAVGLDNETVAQVVRTTLSPSTIVAIIPDETHPFSLIKSTKSLRITIAGQRQMMWTLNNGEMGVDGFNKPVPSVATPTMLDLSAGKS